MLAEGPCQVWSWDITKLRGPQAGSWYSLYVVLDIFSRKIVGWRIETREDAELAEALIAESYTREGVQPHQLTLHADRGAAMTSKTLAELLVDLGVAQSHSQSGQSVSIVWWGDALGDSGTHCEVASVRAILWVEVGTREG